MAYGADAAGLPGELPVMGALVESNLTNLDGGDADTAGYFQIRKAIWNTGPYAGFPDDPPLQLRWFVDQAARLQAAADRAGPAARPERVRRVGGRTSSSRPRSTATATSCAWTRRSELIGPPCADPLPPGDPGPARCRRAIHPVADVAAPALLLGPPSGARRSPSAASP